jgi:hypothetical protein
VLKDNKFLIYGGGLFAGAAITIAILPSGATFCVDNRTMCAPFALPADDEPSGNEPQPLTRIGPLVSATASASSLSPVTMWAPFTTIKT